MDCEHTCVVPTKTKRELAPLTMQKPLLLLQHTTPFHEMINDMSTTLNTAKLKVSSSMQILVRWAIVFLGRGLPSLQ